MGAQLRGSGVLAVAAMGRRTVALAETEDAQVRPSRLCTRRGARIRVRVGSAVFPSMPCTRPGTYYTARARAQLASIRSAAAAMVCAMARAARVVSPRSRLELTRRRPGRRRPHVRAVRGACRLHAAREQSRLCAPHAAARPSHASALTCPRMTSRAHAGAFSRAARLRGSSGGAPRVLRTPPTCAHAYPRGRAHTHTHARTHTHTRRRRTTRTGSSFTATTTRCRRPPAP